MEKEFERFHTLKMLVNEKNMMTSVGDEGGFAPNIHSNSEALEIIIESISKAGYKAGENVYLGLDVASSEFYNNNIYTLKSENLNLSSDEFVSY